MKRFLTWLLCETLGWHDYHSSLVYPPTPVSEVVKTMVQRTWCARCEIESKIHWTWYELANDFHSNEVGWLNDQ